MSIYKGSKKIKEVGEHGIFWGNRAIDAIYKGSQLVYQFVPIGEILFESSTPGTYQWMAPYTAIVDVILVGAGGGGAYAVYGGAFTRSQNGGQGSLITGSVRIIKGTSYEFTVGAAGAGAYDSTGSVNASVATGGTGGDTTAFGNTAGGGGGAYAAAGYYNTNGYNGTGGTASVVSGFTASNGVTGSTTPRYGTYGAGGPGSNNSASGANDGTNGYILIKVKGA